MQLHLIICLFLVENLDFTLNLLRSGTNLISLNALQPHLHVKHLTNSDISQEQGTLVSVLVNEGDMNLLAGIVGEVDRILLPVALESTCSTRYHLLVEHNISPFLELLNHVGIEVVNLFVRSQDHHLEFISESRLEALPLE